MNSSTRVGLFGAAGVLGLTGAGVAAYLANVYRQQGTIDYALQRAPSMQGGRYTEEALSRLVRDRYEIRFLNGRGVPPHVNGSTIVVAAIPPNARRVPLVPPTTTRFVPGGYNRSNAQRIKFFQAIKQWGIGNLDVRVIGLRLAQESGWGFACQQHNIGNRKAQGTLYCESWQVLVNEQRVWTTNQVASGVHGLVDRVRSADFYPSFSSFGDGMRDWLQLLSTPKYSRALEGARRGGLEGCIQFARHLAKEGYSPGTEANAEAEARGYWDSSRSKIGAGPWEQLR